MSVWQLKWSINARVLWEICANNLENVVGSQLCDSVLCGDNRTDCVHACDGPKEEEVKVIKEPSS